MSKIEQNTTDLQAILEAVNALPEAGSGGDSVPLHLESNVLTMYIDGYHNGSTFYEYIGLE